MAKKIKKVKKTKKDILVVPELPKTVKKLLAENENDIREDIKFALTKIKDISRATIALEQRIDRIVTAISKAKSVKGL